MGFRPRGFTLIELSVVLFILVLGLGVVGINIASGSHSAQLKAAARDIVSALRYARGQALISGQEVSVAINLGDNSYFISSRAKEYRLPGDIELTLVIAQDEFDADEVGQIRFYPDGSSSGGRITLEWGQSSYRIDVNWLSGKVDSLTQQ